MDINKQKRCHRRRRRNDKGLVCLLVFFAAAALVILNFCMKSPTSDDPDNTPGQHTVDRPVVEPNVPGNSNGSINADDWHLVLVNRWHALPEDWQPNLVPLDDGWEIDSRCYDSLVTMLDDCRSSGANPLICSAYRSQETQENLFSNQVSAFLAQGYSTGESEKLAATQIAIPGTSEHQLGLAVDIVDIDYQQLDEAQKHTPTQLWLAENSWRYGFILRYPNDKTELTGIIYEPWHYRYVGEEYAKDIYEKGVCLEEYLSGN